MFPPLTLFIPHFAHLMYPFLTLRPSGCHCSCTKHFHLKPCFIPVFNKEHFCRIPGNKIDARPSCKHIPLRSPITDFYIPENAIASHTTVVGVVSATDADGDDITYLGGLSAPPAFVMFGNSVVFFKGQLDYEAEPK